MNFSEVRLLIIEDSLTDMLILKRMLIELGFSRENISEAGKLADVKFADEDLVLSDLNLPDSTGRNTLEWVLKQTKGSGKTVIVLSGLSDEQLAQEAIQLGAQDYLIKGTFSSGVLKKTLTFAFERNRLIKNLEENQYQLSTTKQYLSTILTTAPGTILRFNRDLIIEYHNRHLVGLSSETELVGKSILDFAPEDEKDRALENLRELVNKGETQYFEGKQHNEAGDVFHILYRASAVGDGTFIIVATDITALVESRDELQRQTLIGKETQLQLLSAQMNPHFIFNALSSIQHSVLHNNVEISLNFISSFSVLMRSVLENSRKPLIPWIEEREFLTRYLEIEQFRYEGKFEFQFVEDEDLDIEDISLPPMLIQPYLENTVVHGVGNLTDRNGKVIVALKKSGERYKISISDNGIGREKAIALKELREGSKHVSRAMSINRNRLELLNSVYESDAFEVKVIDLVDDNNVPQGTQIDVYIPSEMW